MFQHDPGHTGVAPVSTAESLELLWAVPVMNPKAGCHLVTSDGGGVWVMNSTEITKVDNRGETIASYYIDDVRMTFLISGSPVVLSDGTLVVMLKVSEQEDERVATLGAIGSDARLRWILPFEGQFNPDKSLLTLGRDDRIYVGCPTCLYAVSPGATMATIEWSYACEDLISTIPAVASDGTVYFGTTNKTPPVNPRLYCLNSDGSLDWTFEPTEAYGGKPLALNSAPTLDDAGHIYFVVSGNALYCLNRDGSVGWSWPIEGFCYTSPILMPDRSIVFYQMHKWGMGGQWAALVTRVDSQLESLSIKLPTDQAPLSSPTTDADGNVFVSFMSWDASTSTKTFQFGLVNMGAYNPDDLFANVLYSPLYSSFDQVGAAGGPCIDEDGTVYCVVGRNLLAFGQRQGLSIGIQTNSPEYAGWLGFPLKVSLRITNANIATPLDCYGAWKQPDKDQPLF